MVCSSCMDPSYITKDVPTDVRTDFQYMSHTYRHEVYNSGAGIMDVSLSVSLSEPHINELNVHNPYHYTVY